MDTPNLGRYCNMIGVLLLWITKEKILCYFQKLIHLVGKILSGEACVKNAIWSYSGIIKKNSKYHFSHVLHLEKPFDKLIHLCKCIPNKALLKILKFTQCNKFTYSLQVLLPQMQVEPVHTSHLPLIRPPG